MSDDNFFHLFSLYDFSFYASYDELEHLRL